jgi:hypothetical protein
MSDDRIVSLADRKKTKQEKDEFDYKAAIVATLEELLQEAKDGTLRGIFYVTAEREHTGEGFAMFPDVNPVEIIGALDILKMRQLMLSQDLEYLDS